MQPDVRNPRTARCGQSNQSETMIAKRAGWIDDEGENRFSRHKATFDHSQILRRTKTAPHFGEPTLAPPWCNRHVGPEHQEAVASTQIGPYFLLRQTALIKLLEQRALALEAGVGGDQPAADAGHRARHHFVPESARAFRRVSPQFIEATDHGLVPAAPA